MAKVNIRGTRHTRTARIDGVKLDIRDSQRALSLASDFSWGQINRESCQLALAILCKYTSDDNAIAKHVSFARQHLGRYELNIYVDVPAWLEANAPRPA